MTRADLPGGFAQAVATSAAAAGWLWAVCMDRTHRCAAALARSQPQPPQPATPAAAGCDQRYSAVEVPLAPSEIAPAAEPGVTLPSPRPDALDIGAWRDLLARVSHDLRTPLNAVIGFSDVMQQELFGPLGDVRYHDYVRHIRDSGNALLRVAEDTLAMTTLVASSHACAYDRVGLAALLVSAWNDLTSRNPARGITLELAVAPDIEVRADPPAMRQAITHLLAAALARTPSGVGLRATATAAHGRVQLEFSVPEIADCHRAEPGAGRQDLALCIARTLLMLQGCVLTEQAGEVAGWTARTELEQVVQQDLFRAPALT